MSRPPKLSPADADAAYAAAQCVVAAHRRIVEFLKVGQKLPEIDAFIARVLTELGCRSAFYGYKIPKSPAFPSFACLSVNDCVVHGTAGYYPHAMKPGDVLKIDIGVVHRGWVGDAAWTYVFKEYPSPLVKKMMASGRESLARGITELRPGNTYRAWAKAVQQCVEKEYGFHLVRGLGGHGYGRRLHEAPFVSNLPQNDNDWPDGGKPCLPGTLVAVEPMITLTTGDTRSHGNQWPVFSADGSVAVHYEHDVLITERGPRVLSEGMESLPDIVG